MAVCSASSQSFHSFVVPARSVHDLTVDVMENSFWGRFYETVTAVI
jgi:hypothetical protein